MTRRPHDVRFLAMLALAGLPGCDGCHRSKPYTPYSLADSEAPSTSAHAGMPASDAGTAFTATPAAPAPGDGKSWPLAGAAVDAPAGHAFVEGLVADFDGDGTADLIAWSRSPDGARGELWFASGKAPANGRVVTALGSSTCKTKPALSQIGPSAILFDVETKCEAASKERSSRLVDVFRVVGNRAPELGLELRLGPFTEGESITVAIDGRDRDGDGRGDLTATFTVEGAPRPLPSGGTASASIAFFDRPAGLSRDPSEPEASFKALALGLIADGRKRTTAARVPGAARAARRLSALLCDEDGHPAVTTSTGNVHCGELKLAQDAAIAEIEAALNLGDPFGAMAAVARLDEHHEHRKDVDGLLAKSISVIAGKLTRATAAAPDVLPPPAFGPIAIISTGDVLVRTRDKIIRVDHATFQESPLEAAIRWPSSVAAAGSPPAWTLLSVDERCDSPTLTGRFQVGSEATEVALPVLVGRCAASSHVPVDVLGASTQGALLGVRGELVVIPFDAPTKPVLAEGLAGAPGGATDLGASRSASGNVVALSTTRGVLVATLKGSGRAASARLWTTPLLDGATACVPGDAADRIACVVKGTVAIYDAK